MIDTRYKYYFHGDQWIRNHYFKYFTVLTFYTEGLIIAATVMILSGIYGPQIWQHPLDQYLPYLPDQFVNLVDSLDLKPAHIPNPLAPNCPKRLLLRPSPVLHHKCLQGPTPPESALPTYHHRMGTNRSIHKFLRHLDRLPSFLNPLS